MVCLQSRSTGTTRLGTIQLYGKRKNMVGTRRAKEKKVEVWLQLRGRTGTFFLLLGRARSEMDEGRAGARARALFHGPIWAERQTQTDHSHTYRHGCSSVSVAVRRVSLLLDDCVLGALVAHLGCVASLPSPSVSQARAVCLANVACHQKRVRVDSRSRVAGWPLWARQSARCGVAATAVVSGTRDSATLYAAPA